jgi:hypothetical protein
VKNVNGLVGLLGIIVLAWVIKSHASTTGPLSDMAVQPALSVNPALLLQSEYAQGIRTLIPDPVPVSRHPLENETLTLTGLGPIVIGMTVEQAERAAGITLVPSTASHTQACQYYLVAPDGLGESDLGFMVIDHRIIRIDAWPGSAVQTTSRIGIGALETEVKTQYLGHLEETPHQYASGKYLTVVPDSSMANLYRMVFETDADGRITQFRAGQFPAVTWVEGCS